MTKPEIRKLDFLKDEVLKDGRDYEKGTLILTFTGPRARNLSYYEVAKNLAGPVGLGAAGMDTLGQYDSSHKWYLTLKDAAHVSHYKNLHGRRFELNEKYCLIDHSVFCAREIVKVVIDSWEFEAQEQASWRSCIFNGAVSREASIKAAAELRRKKLRDTDT